MVCGKAQRYRKVLLFLPLSTLCVFCNADLLEVRDRPSTNLSALGFVEDVVLE